MTRINCLVQYSDEITRVDPGTGDRADGQRFRAPSSANRFMAFGCAPWGGRTEHQGAIHAEPFAFVYGCATVISADGRGMADYEDTLELYPGDTFFVKGFGWHEAYHGGVGRNHLMIRPCAPPDAFLA